MNFDRLLKLIDPKDQDEHFDEYKKKYSKGEPTSDPVGLVQKSKVSDLLQVMDDPDAAAYEKFINRSTKFAFPVKKIIWVIAGLGFIVAFIQVNPALLAVIISLLALVLYHKRSISQKLDALSIVEIKVPKNSFTCNQINVEVVLENSGYYGISNVWVRLEYGHQQFDACIPYIMNHSMGSCLFFITAPKKPTSMTIGPVSLSVRDPIAYQVSTKKSEDVVEVVVEEQHDALTFISSNKAIDRDYMGKHQLEIKGSSDQVLELRPWQNGDLIKSIHWKQSAKLSELIVKDFEETASPVITLLFDQDEDGHSFSVGQSSFVDLQSSVMGIVQTIEDAQLDVQFFSQDQSIPFDKQHANYPLLKRAIKISDMKNVRWNLANLVHHNIHQIPKSSMVMIFSAHLHEANEDLINSFYQLNHLNCEIILVTIDQDAYAKTIFEDASDSYNEADFYHKFSADRKPQEMGKLLSGMAGRTYVITPDKNLKDLYDPSVGL